MTPELTVPVDDGALDAILTALDYTLDWPDGADAPTGIGEFSMHHLLNFWSGYDKSKLVPIGDIGGSPAFEYPEPLLCEADVIRALVHEVRRLRATATPEEG